MPIVPARDESRARRMKLTDKIFKEFGYSTDAGIDCEGCRRHQARMEPMAHSEACRRRLEEAMRSHPDGQKWIQRDDDRINERLAEEVEKAQQDTEEAQEEQGSGAEVEMRPEDQPVP